MKRFALMLSGLLFLCGCGGGGTPTPTPVVTISITTPTTAQTVPVNGTLAITAAVSGTSNTAVTWTVNNITNGNSTYGTISGSGLSVTYTAPAAVPSPATFNVTATSAADTTKSASVSVTISPGVVVSITTPTGPQNLAVNSTLGFTASVTGTSNTGVTWTVNGVTNGNSTYGTISGSGLTVTYDAPAAVPSPATFNVTATSVADSTKSASVSVTISAVTTACTDSGSESLLSGQYAFTLSGFNAMGYLAVVGSFTADGTGKITAGEVDSNGALGAQSGIPITSSGSSYSVGANNLGCATIVTPFYTFNTRFSLGTISSSTATAGRMIEWETGSSAYIAAGQIGLQTASSFSGGISSGSYVFKESGVDGSAGNGRMGGVGVLSVSSGSITAGEVDMNDAGTLQNITGITGTYTGADTSGRFTMSVEIPTVGTSQVAGYMASSSSFVFLTMNSLSSMGALAGQMNQQSVPAGGFGNSSLSGNLVAYQTGLNGGGSGGAASLDLLNANGSGSLTGTSYYDGGGTLKTPSAITATYSVASNGRTTLTSAGNQPPVLYIAGPSGGYMLTQDTDVGIGAFQPQATGPFSTADLPAKYCVGDVEVTNQAEMVSAGAGTFNGSGTTSYTGNFTSTTLQDSDRSGTTTITVNSDGTISSQSNGVIDIIIISSTKFVGLTDESDNYPTVEVAKQ
jgi:hypothetical protein